MSESPNPHMRQKSNTTKIKQTTLKEKEDDAEEST
jgi:hypothetical protein